jgi:hypothetical protein
MDLILFSENFLEGLSKMPPSKTLATADDHLNNYTRTINAHLLRSNGLYTYRAHASMFKVKGLYEEARTRSTSLPGLIARVLIRTERRLS